MNDDDDILAAVDDFGKSGKSSWLSKKPLRRDKPSVKLTLNGKKETTNWLLSREPKYMNQFDTTTIILNQKIAALTKMISYVV